jgi:hypothetical protein
MPDCTLLAARFLVAHYTAGDDSAADALAALTIGTVAGLGVTPDGVAAACVRTRTTGHPGDAEQNPISRTLATALGATSAHIDEQGVTALLFSGPAGEDLSVEGIELPRPVEEFLAGFADGRWEILVDRDVRPAKTRYLRSQARDMDGEETITRGTVVSCADRQGVSEPIPDDLIAAIGAAGLGAEDLSQPGYNSVRLYRGDLCVAMVRGNDLHFFDVGNGSSIEMDASWQACAGYQFCPRVNVHTRFADRDEALRHVLVDLGDVCRDRTDSDS